MQPLWSRNAWCGADMTFQFWLNLASMILVAVSAYQAQRRGEIAPTIFFTTLLVLVYLDMKA